jgi:hypothetical protein
MSGGFKYTETSGSDAQQKIMLMNQLQRYLGARYIDEVLSGARSIDCAYCWKSYWAGFGVTGKPVRMLYEIRGEMAKVSTAYEADLAKATEGHKRDAYNDGIEAGKSIVEAIKAGVGQPMVAYSGDNVDMFHEGIALALSDAGIEGWDIQKISLDEKKG